MVELPLSVYGWRKFQIDTIGVLFGDHLSTCTTHSGVKKTSNWLVTSRMWGVRCLWCGTYALFMSVLEVPLTLILVDTYITVILI
jgi:hypothetical protein